jgi:hypothetical protein
MLNSVIEIVKYPLKVVPALVKAVKKARENQDAGFFEKLGIFWETFSNSMRGIEKEKKEVTKGAQAMVRGSITETTKRVQSAVKLKKKPKGKDKERFDKIIAVSVRGFGQLDGTTRGHTQKAVKKLGNTMKGQKETFNYNQVACLGASTTAVLLELKRQYPNKKKFKKALDHYLKISEGSNFPLKKLMKFSTLKIFKLKSFGDKFKLVRALGLLSPSGVAGLVRLKGLAKSPIKDEAKIVKFFKKNVFKNTSSSNVKRIVKRINRIYLRGGNAMNTEDITELVFLIHDKDFKRLTKVLSGGRS